MSKEKLFFTCVTDTYVHIIAVKDIIKMAPVIIQNDKPYIRIDIKIQFEDYDAYITDSIYCSRVEPYLTSVIP